MMHVVSPDVVTARILQADDLKPAVELPAHCERVRVAAQPRSLSKAFQALARRAGLPTIGLHGLRHTAATLMQMGGVCPRSGRSGIGGLLRVR